MLKKYLTVTLFASAAIANFLGANDFAEKDQPKSISPGAFVCNGKETVCNKEGDKDNNEGTSPSAALFSALAEDERDATSLLACKRCR